MYILLVCLALFACSANAISPMVNLAAVKYYDIVEGIRLKGVASGVKYPQAQWFDQKLDHFNAQENRTWKQRYYVNDTFYNRQKGGPIYFQLGGEAAISGAYVVSLMMAEYARNDGALMVALEHRFYGESHPLPDMSTENLAFLSSQQALADAANFITAFKAQYPNVGKVISFGGSYPGSLSSWFRLKYPHITYGAIASSAPVLAVLDMISYLDVVDEALSDIAGQTCHENIQKATNVIEDLLKTADGRSQVQKYFNSCNPLTTDKDIATFMNNLMGNWMGVVQYNNERPSSPNITALCYIMDDESQSPLNNYIKVAKIFSGSQCMDNSYNNMLKQLKDVNAWGLTSVGERQWTYQTCAEFGFFQTTDSDEQPFGDMVPLSYYTDICKEVFGFDWLPRIDDTNAYYGAEDPQSTNVVFVNGSIDPWHSLSILEDKSDTLLAIYIKGTAHCADMMRARPTDPAGLAKAQNDIARILTKWVNE